MRWYDYVGEAMGTILFVAFIVALMVVNVS